jgi:aspartyl-tRNA(Asn)/glutamyl-tRNA(Gln) amidotransferase subunit A
MPAKDNLHLKKAREIAAMVNNKEISAVEVTKYFLQRAEELDQKVNAFNCLTPELAFRQAEEVDKKIAAGQSFPLAGVPIAIKDNLCVKGTKTTCSSKILENFVAPYESTVTQKLWEAGAICLGKTNLDEFAMGSSTEHSAFKTTKNPWDLGRVPGGSSGGSAAAVAARLAPLSLGSDTGGSIRQPASLCGIVGMKPTYGVVSRFGLIAFTSSLDQIGPFATDIEDADLLLSVISGFDQKDSTSIEKKVLGDLKAKDLSGLKIGIIKELVLNENNASPSMVSIFQNTINKLKAQGAEVEEVSMPTVVNHALDVYYIIAPAEASSNLARYEGVRFGFRDEKAKNLNEMFSNSRAIGFGPEVKRRIMIGTYALSAGYYDAYYKKAQQVRKLITDQFNEVFKKYDVLLSPTSPLTAFPFGSKTDDPLSMYLCDIATIPANLAGLPAISLNCGFDENNLPVGLQLMSSHGKDQEMINIALSFEKLFAEENTKLPDLVKSK